MVTQSEGYGPAQKKNVETTRFAQVPVKNLCRCSRRTLAIRWVLERCVIMEEFPSHEKYVLTVKVIEHHFRMFLSTIAFATGQEPEEMCMTQGIAWLL